MSKLIIFVLGFMIACNPLTKSTSFQPDYHPGVDSTDNGNTGGNNGNNNAPSSQNTYSQVDGIQISTGNGSASGSHFSANVNASLGGSKLTGSTVSAEIQFNTVDAR